MAWMAFVACSLWLVTPRLRILHQHRGRQALRDVAVKVLHDPSSLLQVGHAHESHSHLVDVGGALRHDLCRVDNAVCAEDDLQHVLSDVRRQALDVEVLGWWGRGSRAKGWDAADARVLLVLRFGILHHDRGCKPLRNVPVEVLHYPSCLLQVCHAHASNGHLVGVKRALGHDLRGSHGAVGTEDNAEHLIRHVRWQALDVEVL
mmetsp:Transcript_56672/g.156859  ORF Transcript_56672/g.156859 Transcript_56672/m.156859 type:complete len:204 (+) Transcript_56672:486-1097(+)